jgi:hypothetical protein
MPLPNPQVNIHLGLARSQHDPRDRFDLRHRDLCRRFRLTDKAEPPSIVPRRQIIHNPD